MISGSHLYPSFEGQRNSFLTLVADYPSVFVALNRAGVTMGMWTQQAITRFLSSNEDFWKIHLGDKHNHQTYLKHQILIINFIAGNNHERLEWDNHTRAYMHSCSGLNHYLYTIEDMIWHIEQHHTSDQAVHYLAEFNPYAFSSSVDSFIVSSFSLSWLIICPNFFMYPDIILCRLISKDELTQFLSTIKMVKASPELNNYLEYVSLFTGSKCALGRSN